MKLKSLSLAVALACSSTGFAIAAPTSGAYVTDPQNEWVQDKLSEAISTPNTITCFMSALRADAMVNQGNYVALIDFEKCESSKRGEDNSSSTNAGASAAVNYTRVVVNSARATNNDPMVVKVWFPLAAGGPGGATMAMFAQASVTESPSSTNPNGGFSMSFCGVPANQANPLLGACSMTQGTLSASGTTMTFSEAWSDGSTPSTTKLTISRAADGSSGSGRVTTTGWSVGDNFFAFDAGYFKRGTSGSNACFSRDRSNAKYSTWRYGVYNGNGSRLGLTNPGFNIQATLSGETYWGHAGFWGVFLPSNVLNSGSVTTVNRMTPGSNATTTYDLTKSGGKLYKMTKATSTLDATKGQSMMTWLPANVVSGDSSGGQYELTWNGANVLAVRKQGVCDQNGCAWTDLSGTSPQVTASSLRTAAPWMQALQGWSQSAGGEVRVAVPQSGEFSGSTPLATRTREVVLPGSVGAPANLVCASRCPKGGLQASDFTSGSPYQNITFNNWGGGTTTVNSEFSFQPVATGNAINYSFPSTGLLMFGGSAVDASALTLTGNNQWGFQSGRLVEAGSASYTASRCASGSQYQQSDTGNSLCPGLIDDAPVFYTYETGPNPWNRYIGLSSGGTPVTFDPPKSFNLTVTTGNTTESADSPLINSIIRLDYNGFGELHGIPGKCVSSVTNLPETCGNGSANQRWVPAFSIRDGAELTNGGTTYYAKYLDREMRFGKVADGNCSSLTLPAGATLPGAPSDDPRSNGLSPTVTDAPKVVHGVVQ